MADYNQIKNEIEELQQQLSEAYTETANSGMIVETLNREIGMINRYLMVNQEHGYCLSPMTVNVSNIIKDNEEEVVTLYPAVQINKAIM